MKNKEYFRSRIKEIRLSSNLSQHRFGRKLGVSGKTISSYEKGRCIPSLRVMEKIERTYNTLVIPRNRLPNEDNIQDTILKIKEHLTTLELILDIKNTS